MSLTRIGSIGINTGIAFAGVTTIVTLNTANDALSIGATVNVGSGITLGASGDIFFTGIATGNGSGLTALNATQLTSGTVPTARLGSGTASSSTFLRGDSSFQTITTDLVGDTSPQLGGDLASNGHDILIADSDFIKFGTGNDLTIKHNGTHSVIENFTNDLYLGTSTSGQIILQKQGGDVLAKFISGASVELYENGTKVAETTSGGFNVEGVTYSNGLDMDDSHKILLGTDDDLELYHNGSNAYIKNGTGQLLLRSGTHTFENANGSTEYARIDSGGRLLINTTTNRNKYFNGTYTGQLQVEGTDDSTRLTQLVHNSNSASQHIFVLGKSRGTSTGSYTVVQDDDFLGTISFQGADGDEMVDAARIEVQVNGTPGNDNMPADMIFKTNTGSSSPAERLRITEAGRVLIGADSQGSADGYTNNFMIAETSGSAGMSIQSYNSASSYSTIALGDRTTHNRGFIEQRCGDNNQMTIGLSGNGSFRFIGKNSGGTSVERVRITYDGVTFNGDTAAANAIDDYEEGTWTPTVISSGGGTSSYTTQQGTYVKIGRVVHVTCQIVHTLSGASGYLRVGGIPYNCSNNTGSEYLGVTQWNQSSASVNTNIVNVVPIIQQNNNYIHFRGYRYPANTAYENIGTAEHSWLRVTMTYETGA